MATFAVSYALYNARFLPNLSSYSSFSLIYSAFHNISCSTSSGGAVYISASVSFSMSFASFVGCSSVGYYGGGIYTTSLVSAYISQSCATDCYATNYGQFCVFFSSLIDVKQVSYTQCPSNRQGIWVGFFMGGSSSQKATSANATNNFPSSRVPSFDSYNSQDTLISYCTFVSNDGDSIIETTIGVDNRTVSQTNFVNNTNQSSFYGIAYVYNSVIFNQCIFEGNTHKVYFFVAIGTAVVTNCFFDLSALWSGTVSISGSTIGTYGAQTWRITYLDLAKCLIAPTMTITQANPISSIRLFSAISFTFCLSD